MSGTRTVRSRTHAAFRALIGDDRRYAFIEEGPDELWALARRAVRLGFPWWAPWYGCDPPACPLCDGPRHDYARQIQDAVHYIDRHGARSGERLGQHGDPLRVFVVCYGDAYPAA